MERRGSRLSRREFVVGAGAASLALVAGCGRLPGQAQRSPARVPRVGMLVRVQPKLIVFSADNHRRSVSLLPAAALGCAEARLGGYLGRPCDGSPAGQRMSPEQPHVPTAHLWPGSLP